MRMVLTLFGLSEMTARYASYEELAQIIRVRFKEPKKDLKELDSNLISAEKFAREKYFMKKANEDVFVIVKEQEKK